MFINRKIVFTAAVALLLGASSCKKYLNVNTNPNVSQTATVQTLLPAAELYVGSSVGVDLQIDGSIWAQYWTQAPNTNLAYQSIDQYAPTQANFSDAWTDLYAAAENFYQLYNLADSQHKKQYMAIALLMQAYTFQVITDAWGDVPFSQALKGQYINGHVINPKYDSQLVVYNGILADIDSANKLINLSDPEAPGADDLIYGGKMAEWVKFSNTLQMKVLLRMADINPGWSQIRIAALFNSVPYPAFIGSGDDAKISYGSSSANKNPLYAETSSAKYSGVQNLAASQTCIDSMNSNSDPRIYLFYEPAAAGSFVGIPQSAYNVAATSGSYSIPNVYVAGDNTSSANAASADAPVNLLTSWESYFMQAEVAVRGWATTSLSDNTLFYDGIQASFNYAYYNTALSNVYGAGAYASYIAGNGYWTVYPTSGTNLVTNKLRFILTQKWFAMCGNQGFEAWCELRRTGYPDFLVHPVNSQISNNRPERFLYPTSESTGNSNFPSTGVAPVTSRVWWDIASVNW